MWQGRNLGKILLGGSGSIPTNLSLSESAGVEGRGDGFELAEAEGGFLGFGPGGGFGGGDGEVEDAVGEGGGGAGEIGTDLGGDGGGVASFQCSVFREEGEVSGERGEC
jgi:hypothetical protein